MEMITHVRGDITIFRDADAICHQVNCLTVKAHGLSKKIAHAYPWADIYSKRNIFEVEKSRSHAKLAAKQQHFFSDSFNEQILRLT